MRNEVECPNARLMLLLLLIKALVVKFRSFALHPLAKVEPVFGSQDQSRSPSLASSNDDMLMCSINTLAIRVRALGKRLTLPQTLIVITQWRRTARSHAGRAGSHSPIIIAHQRVAVPMSELGQVVLLLHLAPLMVADLNIIVIPSGPLILLNLWQEVRACDKEDDSRNHGAAHEVNSVVVRQVHGRPPKPHHISRKKRTEAWETVGHKQGLHDRRPSMQRWEGSEHQRRVDEIGRVHINTKQLIDPRQPSRGTRHVIVCWCQTVLVLVPRSGTRERGLDGDADEVHDAERAGEDWNGARSREEEHGEGADGWPAKVDDAVWEPRQHVEDGVLVCGEDVGEVGAVENVFERWENFDPDVWADLLRDEAGGRGLAIVQTWVVIDLTGRRRRR